MLETLVLNKIVDPLTEGIVRAHAKQGSALKSVYIRRVIVAWIYNHLGLHITLELIASHGSQNLALVFLVVDQACETHCILIYFAPLL